MTTYRNSFYSKTSPDSKEFYSCDSNPVEYEGFLIYHRIKSSTKGADVFDIVKDGICVGMCAGLEGAKNAIIKKINHNKNEIEELKI